MKTQGKLGVLLLLTFANTIALHPNGWSKNRNIDQRYYSLPKTELILEVVSEETTETPGMLLQFSERFLGNTNAIKTPRTHQQIKSITISTRTVPDPKRTYAISPTANTILSHLVVNEKGILCGINTTLPTILEEKIVKILPREDSQSSQENSGLLPLGEEYMRASSLVKMAEGVAKQIYRIRENRINLLSDDVENMPNSGDGLRTLFYQMNLQERKLTELFIGTKTTRIRRNTIIFAPQKQTERQVVFRFSPILGVVDALNLSGAPIFLEVIFDQNPPQIFNSPTSPLLSIQPALVAIRILDENRMWAEQQLYIPQFGQIVDVPIQKLKNDTEIIISPKNGRLISIGVKQ